MSMSESHRGDRMIPNGIKGLIGKVVQVAFDDTFGLVVRGCGQTTSNDLIRLITEGAGIGAGTMVGMLFEDID